MKRLIGIVCGLILIAGCGKSLSDTKKEKEQHVLRFLSSKNWAGLIAGQPVTLTVTGPKEGTIVYTYFGKPGVEQPVSWKMEGDTLTITGKSYKRLLGTGEFYLDTLTGKISADSVSIGGSVPTSAGMETWSLAWNQSIGEIDPPLDKAWAHEQLIKGRWEGRVEKRPATLTFQKKGQQLAAVMAYGNARVNLSVTIGDEGAIKMKAQDRPTSQGLQSESFDGMITREMEYIQGHHELSVKQGFVEQSSGGVWVVVNKKAKK